MIHVQTFGFVLLLAVSLNAAVVRYDTAGNPGPGDGAACPARPAPCVFVVSCATGTCTDAERIHYQSVVDTETWLGDTLKFQAGHLFPSYTAPAALQLGGRPGSGYLTITTTEDAKLPPDGHRITPAYRSVMPTFRADTNASAGIALKGTTTPAEHMIIRGVRMTPKEGSWSIQYNRGLIQAGNTGLDWGYCDTSSCTTAGNVKGAYRGPGGAIRLTIYKHGWSTGDTIIVGAIPGIPAFASLSAWKITVVNADTVELDGSTFSGSFPGTGNAGRQTVFDNIAWQPDDILIQHILIEQQAYADAVRTGILLNTRGVTLKDSWIDGIQNPDGESKAVTSIAGQGPITISNNYLAAAGENIFFGGARPATYTTPSDITIRHNYITKPPEQWRRRRWTPGLLVFRGAVVYTNTNTSTMAGYTYIALTTGRTGATEPADALAGYPNSWPALGYSTLLGCSFTPGAHTCLRDGDVIWARKGTTYWQVKNNFECKACMNVLVEHNVFDGNWINGQDAMFNLKTANQCLNSVQSRPTRRAGVVNATPMGDGRTLLTRVSGDKLPYIPKPGGDSEVFLISVNGITRTIDSSPSVTSVAAGFVSEDNLIIREDIGSGTGLAFLHGRGIGPNGLDVADRCFEAKTQNVTIRHNILRNGPVALKTFLDVNSQYGNLSDISVTNNLFHNIDRCEWGDLYSTSPCTTKWDFMLSGPHPNIRFENNTAMSTSGGAIGPYSTMTTESNMQMDVPLSMRNNILLRGSSSGIKGSGRSEGAASIEPMFCGGKPCPALKFDRNFILGANASLYYGPSRTITLCPSSTVACAASGITPPLTELFMDYSNRNFRIHPRAQAARNRGTDGRDPGVDHRQLPQVLNHRVQTTATAAALSYEVSAPIASIPCVAQVSSSPDLWLSIPDLDPALWPADIAPTMNSDVGPEYPGSARSRSLIVGARQPLSPSTEYFYLLMCGGDAVRGQFTTAPSPTGATTQMAVERRTGAAALKVEYGYAYDRRTGEIANAEAVTRACGSARACSAEWPVKRDSIVYYRWSEQDSSGQTIRRGPVQMAAIR